MKTRASFLIAWLAAMQIAFTPTSALAQATQAPTQAQNITALPRRQANYAWDKSLLRASFSFKDVIDKPTADKLASGLPTVIVMRAYVYEDGKSDPIALAARTCRVTYDLWDEVYRVTILDASGERNLALINLEGVLRTCGEARDYAIIDRSLLTAGKAHFLGVIVEVDPISPQMLAQIRQWISRPTGSTGASAGNAIFGSTVNLFFRQIGTAARTLSFRTQTFIP